MTFPRSIILALPALVILLPPPCLAAEEPAAEPPLTPAEKEFAALADDYFDELKTFWQQLDKINNPQELDAFYAERDPAIGYMPKFVAFEREHAGEDVGLDAIGEILSYAGRGGGTASAAYAARRKMLARLPTYEDRELAVGAFHSMCSGNYDPRIVDYLRRTAVSPRACSIVRETARFTLAKKLLSLRDGREVLEQKLALLEARADEASVQEAQDNREFFQDYPSGDQLAAGVREAVAILQDLAASGEKFRQPVIRTIDPSGRIARIDPERTKSAPFLSETAAALLFKEQHLRPGQPAPEMDIELVDRRKWSLASHRGRVVVIQFSFTGCGPCEQMYPDLRELDEQFAERLSILTLLRDATPDHGREGIDSGRFTWNIGCDGLPGRFTKRWAVDSFPTIYVIDPAGRVAAVNLRGDALKQKVTDLVP